MVALDIQDPKRVGFAVARRVLGSRVEHVQASVYEALAARSRPIRPYRFRGVYYHLKYPLLAFEEIGKALKLGGWLHFEGEAALNHVENLDGQRVEVDLQTLARLRVPVCFSYPNRFKNASNWSVPNLPCMESWLTAAGFKLIWIKTWETEAPPNGGQRMFGVGEKVRNQSEQLEHPLY